MLKLSKKMLFAIEAVVDIAYHAAGETVQSRDITERQGIPKRYLEQTLQQLCGLIFWWVYEGPVAAIDWRANVGESR